LGYLLAWAPLLNQQDVEGLTPLHLAVRFVDQSENTRSVRLILLRGASKTVKDKNGRMPIDLLSEIKT
jgi:ankyrin repeat protein